MTYSTACNDCMKMALDIVSIDENMSDGDLVYLKDLSLTVVTSELSLNESHQSSLRKTLCEKLGESGRKRLAERIIKKQSIMCKDLKILVNYINNPRTRKTLLERGYQQFYRNRDSLPDLVKRDIERNKIIQLPENIHDLYLMMTSSLDYMKSRVLLKHLVTECLEIDANSRFEVVIEEIEECSELILSKPSNAEELNKQIEYAATLHFFKNILKYEKSDDWNECMLASAHLACAHFTIITHTIEISDSDSEQSLVVFDEINSDPLVPVLPVEIQEKSANQETIGYSRSANSSESSASGEDLDTAEEITESSLLPISDATNSDSLLSVEIQEKSDNQETIGYFRSAHSSESSDSGKGFLSEILEKNTAKLSNLSYDFFVQNEISKFFMSIHNANENENEEDKYILIYLEVNKFEETVDLNYMVNHPSDEGILILKFIESNKTMNSTIYSFMNDITDVKCSIENEAKFVDFIIQPDIIKVYFTLRNQIIDSGFSSRKIIGLNDAVVNILCMSQQADTITECGKEDGRKNDIKDNRKGGRKSGKKGGRKCGQKNSEKKISVTMKLSDVNHKLGKNKREDKVWADIDYNGIKVALVNGYMTGFDKEKSNDASQKVSTANSSLKSEQGDQACFLGARPKQYSATQREPNIKVSQCINICDEDGFSDLLLDCNDEVQNEVLERVTNVLNYIDDPKNEDKYKIAEKSFLNGLWFSHQYFDLLSRAYAVRGDSDFLKKLLDGFIQNDSFYKGCPPGNLVEQEECKRGMYSLFHSNHFIHYTLKKDCTPSDGMDSCANDFWLVDQGVYIDYINFIALLRYWGPELFNLHFHAVCESSDPFELMSFRKLTQRNRLGLLINFDKKLDFKKAHVYIFQNHEKYGHKDFSGEFHRIYAFCDSRRRPTVHFCSPCLPANASILTIYKKMIREYNKDPVNERIMTAQRWALIKNGLKSDPLLDTEDITIKELIRSGGGLSLVSSYGINFSEISGIKLTYKRNLKYEERLRKTEQIRVQEVKENKRYIENLAVLACAESESESESEAEKQPQANSLPVYEVNAVKEEPERDLASMFVININELNKIFKQHEKKGSKKYTKDLVFSSCDSLKKLYAEIKKASVTISDNDQKHYFRIIRLVENM